MSMLYAKQEVVGILRVRVDRAMVSLILTLSETGINGTETGRFRLVIEHSSVSDDFICLI